MLFWKSKLEKKIEKVFDRMEKTLDKLNEDAFVNVFGPSDDIEHYSKRENRDYTITDSKLAPKVIEKQLKKVSMKDIEQKPGDVNRVSLKEPSLQKLLLKGRISQNQYNALCSGDRNDILLAFNIELMDMSDKIVSDLVAKKGVEDFKASEDIEVGE